MAITSESAISWSNNKPVWDFTKTAAYPIQIQQSGKTPTVYVYMTPYTPEELKDVLKKALSGYKREKRDVELVREDKSIYTPLCDAHFVKLGNATGTPEAQKAWLDKRPELKPDFVEHTFGGLRMDLPKEEDEGGMLDIGLELSGEILIYQDIYDEITDKVVRVDMKHKFSQPSESQYRKYRGARRNKFLGKKTLWTVSEEHGLLEKLYGEVVDEIEGGAVNGLPCSSGSGKAEWIKHVPLWHKLFVVDQIFGEIVEKNG